MTPTTCPACGSRYTTVHAYGTKVWCDECKCSHDMSHEENDMGTKLTEAERTRAKTLGFTLHEGDDPSLIRLLMDEEVVERTTRK